MAHGMDRFLPPQTGLTKYDAMVHAISVAYEVDEVTDIRDKARAAEVYFQQAKNVESERRAVEIRLRAERKAGQLLKEMEKAKGGGDTRTSQKQKHPSCDTRGARKTLAEMGISYDQSAKWQKIAELPENKFEAALAAPEKPTTKTLTDLAESVGIIPTEPTTRLVGPGSVSV